MKYWICWKLTLANYYLDYSYGHVGSLGFSQGTGSILLGYLNCSGTEANLVKCNQNYKHTHVNPGCQYHYYDAAVICECKYGSFSRNFSY